MERINTLDVLVVGGGKRTLDVFFFAKKARNERWEVVPCCIARWLMFLPLRAGGGAPWRLQGGGVYHGWGVFVVLSPQKRTNVLMPTWRRASNENVNIEIFFTPK
jgi:hypothetical protein